MLDVEGIIWPAWPDSMDDPEPISFWFSLVMIVVIVIVSVVVVVVVGIVVVIVVVVVVVVVVEIGVSEWSRGDWVIESLMNQGNDRMMTQIHFSLKMGWPPLQTTLMWSVPADADATDIAIGVMVNGIGNAKFCDGGMENDFGAMIDGWMVAVLPPMKANDGRT